MMAATAPHRKIRNIGTWRHVPQAGDWLGDPIDGSLCHLVCNLVDFLNTKKSKK
jgi:hypothetical protein